MIDRYRKIVDQGAANAGKSIDTDLREAIALEVAVGHLERLRIGLKLKPIPREVLVETIYEDDKDAAKYRSAS